MPNESSQWQQALLERNQLPPAYLVYAQKWFAPLTDILVRHQNSAGRPLLVAVNGCQGSGKTTVCDYLRGALQAEYGLSVVTLSLDDFYLTRRQRTALAGSVHPLLATRGVPGTHDMNLLRQTLDALLVSRAVEPVPIPRFDKAIDDRRPRTDWDQVSEGVDLVLLEGWCLGAMPQTSGELSRPVNTLERDEDPDGHWRSYANKVLREDFLPLYQRVDHWVMLRAPSFDCVYRWRLEQEDKLAGNASGGVSSAVMDAGQVSGFIQYFERLTLQCLELLPGRVDDLYQLDARRQVSACEHRWGPGS